MAAYPVTDERYAPIYFTRFTTYTGGLVLHAANAPAAAQYLPCQLIVEVGTATQHLDITDSAGTASVITFPAVGTYVLRLAPVSLQSTTNVLAVTACWSQRG
jgi:hypothetical protein